MEPFFPSTLEAAREYVSFGWSVFPLKPRSKQARVRWKEFQTRLATSWELNRWFWRTTNNIAIVTGKISGINVVDDDGEGLNFNTLTSSTSPGKRHLYVKHHHGIRNSVRVGGKDYDIRGEGGYVVAPPSTHPSGERYSWNAAPGPDAVQDFPIELQEQRAVLRFAPSRQAEGDGPKRGGAIEARASSYVSKIDLPEDGAGSDDGTFRAAIRVFRAFPDLDVELVSELLYDRTEELEMETRDGHPWDFEWIDSKVQNAARALEMETC